VAGDLDQRGTMAKGKRCHMKKSRRFARWLHLSRLSVVEFVLPRQVTPTRAPGDPTQSMTVLLLAPIGIESAAMTAGMLHLGVGKVFRISTIATLRHVNHQPSQGDVAIVRPAQRLTSRRLLKRLKRAGWTDVIITRGGVDAAEILDLPVRTMVTKPVRHEQKH